ncbi:Zn(2)-C6 fungal-type domain-containing protein [Mycena venus]|uniref:Zn(2)-C6 fungal-type domain-containing protein n=1 Tax=Mycena venus TaxID=2733690 RepID=A0A8H6XX47_9AGAR|nr:Zn(2)-C6 fungal-type domain-containing protein [Mycena venus]
MSLKFYMGYSYDTKLSDAFGALAVGASGTPRYFGPTAGPSAFLAVQGSSGGDRAEFAPPFADIVDSFPFAGGYTSSSWDTHKSLEILFGLLPDELRAWALYDIYGADAAWYGTPIMPDELHVLIVYFYDPKSNIYECSPHTLAVLFFAFSLAASVDLALPPYNADADTYFDLGRAALTLQSVFGSPDLHTIQALALAGLCSATGGARFNTDSAWTMISMAAGFCQRVTIFSLFYVMQSHLLIHSSDFIVRANIFVLKIRWRNDDEYALFWEVYSLETYNSLSFGRPPTISLADVSCEFPADDEQTMEAEGGTVPGFFRTKWRFTKEVTAPMAQVYANATSPSYDKVLDLDQRLRQFMEAAPFSHYYTGTGERNTFLAYVRANIVPRFAGNLMVYMHRGWFVQALKDMPLNPLESPYAASFLAAYRGASMIIKSDSRSFSLFPDHFHRWWPIWKSLVNASFIVGSIAAKSPTSPMAGAALSQLVAAVDLIERGATHSFLAEGSLVVLKRLRNKATARTTRDFEMLAGSRAFVERDLISNPVSSPVRDLAKPILIPGVLPPPVTTSDLWQTQLLDGWHSSFPSDLLVMDPATSSRELETYLATQMQITSEVPPAQFLAGSPVSENEWQIFLSSLDQ